MEMETERVYSGRTKERSDGDRRKRGKRGGKGIFQAPDPLPSYCSAQVCALSCPSLAMHLGPNGEGCQNELGHYGCRDHFHQGKDKYTP